MTRTRRFRYPVEPYLEVDTLYKEVAELTGPEAWEEYVRRKTTNMEALEDYLRELRYVVIHLGSGWRQLTIDPDFPALVDTLIPSLQLSINRTQNFRPHEIDFGAAAAGMPGASYTNQWLAGQYGVDGDNLANYTAGALPLISSWNHYEADYWPVQNVVLARYVHSTLHTQQVYVISTLGTLPAQLTFPAPYTGHVVIAWCWANAARTTAYVLGYDPSTLTARLGHMTTASSITDLGVSLSDSFAAHGGIGLQNGNIAIYMGRASGLPGRAYWYTTSGTLVGSQVLLASGSTAFGLISNTADKVVAIRVSPPTGNLEILSPSGLETRLGVFPVAEIDGKPYQRNGPVVYIGNDTVLFGGRVFEAFLTQDPADTASTYPALFAIENTYPTATFAVAWVDDDPTAKETPGLGLQTSGLKVAPGGEVTWLSERGGDTYMWRGSF